MFFKLASSVILIAILLIGLCKKSVGWRYQTKCTTAGPGSIKWSDADSYSILEDFERLSEEKPPLTPDRHMRLKCPNVNDFLFIGLTQYGVSVQGTSKNIKDDDSCRIAENDCLVTVDYLANQCNGLNHCDIQLESQFLHTCKNSSDYLSVAYDCIPGSKRLDVCASQELFLIDSANRADNELNSRFGSFYLASPGYPNEYTSGLNNCSCHMEFISIDDGTGPKQNFADLKMNLKIKSYEFDLEEGESRSSSPKDGLLVEAFDADYIPMSTLHLLGQQKDFKEFYSSGNSFKLNFTTDDIITRRGFLLEISTMTETFCPSNTERFGSEKCVKYVIEGLSWSKANEACEAQSGRLLTITDFVDNLKLNNLVRSKLGTEFEALWAGVQMRRGKNKNPVDARFLNLKRNVEKPNECLSKKFNEWIETSCNTKLPFICEFDPIKVNKAEELIDSKNRLIRVSCGSLSNVYLKTSAQQTSSTTTTTKQQALKIEPIKLLSWSSLLNRKVQSNPTPTSTVPSILLDIYSLGSQKLNENPNRLKQERLVVTKSLPSPTKTNSALLSQELVLAIAIVSGISLVFILINVFCIWNYYNKKLRDFIDKSETNTENYRTSTMISRTGKSSSTCSNNRSMSTVDSYVKVAPGESSHEHELVAQAACLLSNDQKIDYLRNYFQIKRSQQQNQPLLHCEPHYYETLSTRHYNNYSIGDLCSNIDCLCGRDHVLRPFESIVILPNSSASNSTSSNNSSAYNQIPAATVLLLNHLNNPQTGEVSPASSSTSSSTNPLITFSSFSTASSVTQQSQQQQQKV